MNNDLKTLMLGGDVTMVDGSTKTIKTWAQATTEEHVNIVMNMTVKKLTGPLTYGFHLIARTVAVQAAQGVENPSEVVQRVFREIYSIFTPMIELVMDNKKVEGGKSSLGNITVSLQSIVNGKVVDIETFSPFLEAKHPELMADLRGAIHSVGYSLSGCRNTAYGTVVAAGRKLKENTNNLIKRMIRAGINSSDILIRLQNDALGIEICNLPRGAAPDPVIKNLPSVDVIEDGKGIEAMLKSIKVMGMSVFSKIVSVDIQNDGIKVVAFFLPVWAKPDRSGNVPATKIDLLLPFPKKVTEDGHHVVYLAGGQERLFQPIFILKDGEVVKKTVSTYIREAVVSGVETVVEYEGKLTKSRIEERIQRSIINAVNALTESNEQNNLVALQEFRLMDLTNENVREDLDNMETILTWAANNGFNVVTTSKNKPGTVITKANEFGLPQRLMEICPLGNLMDGKRQVEWREIRKALPLHTPGNLPIRLAGSEARWFEPYLFVANTAIFNCNLNVFVRKDGTRFQHDTLIGTASLKEKMALKSLTIKVNSVEERANLIQALLAQGFTSDQIEVIEIAQVRGRGLTVQQEAVRVTGKILDIGKIKSAVGAVKGIPHIIPHMLFAVDADGNKEVIDLVVTKETVNKKLDRAMVVGMKLAAAGVTEVSPTDNIEEMLEAAGDAGMKTIVAVYEDGTEEILGRTLVGPVPFFRPVQTSLSLFKDRTGNDGISIPTHALVMLGRGLRTPKWVNARMTQAVDIIKSLDLQLKGKSEAEPVVETDDMPEFSDDDAPKQESQSVTCPTCAGEGDIHPDHNPAGEVCPTCKGAQYVHKGTMISMWDAICK